MKRGILGLIFIITYGTLLHLGLSYQEYFKKLTSLTYNPCPYLIFMTVFPIFMGVLLALPHIQRTMRGKEKLTIDKYRLIFMGIPTFYAAIMPLALFSPIGRYLPVRLMIIQYDIVSFAAGTAFGYIIITSFHRKTTRQLTSNEEQLKNHR